MKARSRTALRPSMPRTSHKRGQFHYLPVFVTFIFAVLICAVGASAATFILKWGTEGVGDSQFEAARGVAVDSAGNVYVADTNNHTIRKITFFGVVTTLAVLGYDETEPTRVGGEPPDDEIHLLGQAEAVATNLQQIARRHERLQLTLEGGALLARHAKHLHQLACGRGVMNRLANAVKKVLIATQRE